LQGRGEVDETLLRRVLYGISCRNYESAAEVVPGAIGLSDSTVSRWFLEASAGRLRELQERDLSELDLVAVFLDGKTFADDEMVLALAVTLEGRKVVLGFVQTETENGPVVGAFLRCLRDRGLDVSSGVLVIMDGSKGFRAGVRKAWKKVAVVQRCQWHKRENVVQHLPRGESRQRGAGGFSEPTDGRRTRKPSANSRS